MEIIPAIPEIYNVWGCASHNNQVYIRCYYTFNRETVIEAWDIKAKPRLRNKIVMSSGEYIRNLCVSWNGDYAVFISGGVSVIRYDTKKNTLQPLLKKKRDLRGHRPSIQCSDDMNTIMMTYDFTNRITCQFLDPNRSSVWDPLFIFKEDCILKLSGNGQRVLKIVMPHDKLYYRNTQRTEKRLRGMDKVRSPERRNYLLTMSLITGEILYERTIEIGFEIEMKIQKPKIAMTYDGSIVYMLATGQNIKAYYEGGMVEYNIGKKLSDASLSCSRFGSTITVSGIEGDKNVKYDINVRDKNISPVKPDKPVPLDVSKSGPFYLHTLTGRVVYDL